MASIRIAGGLGNPIFAEHGIDQVGHELRLARSLGQGQGGAVVGLFIQKLRFLGRFVAWLRRYPRSELSAMGSSSGNGHEANDEIDSGMTQGDLPEWRNGQLAHHRGKPAGEKECRQGNRRASEKTGGAQSPTFPALPTDQKGGDRQPQIGAHDPGKPCAETKTIQPE